MQPLRTRVHQTSLPRFLFLSDFFASSLLRFFASSLIQSGPPRGLAVRGPCSPSARAYTKRRFPASAHSHSMVAGGLELMS
ncbi:hypothetical protein HNQ78_002712 [Phycisphaera mikurensis]|nr:hypothetical protein [Phycisphaera mikurensis]